MKQSSLYALTAGLVIASVAAVFIFQHGSVDSSDAGEKARVGVDSFGADFGNAFRADENSDPIDPGEGSVISSPGSTGSEPEKGN